MQTPSDSIVIIPTYNERENIENIIRAVFGLDKVFHILIIEDGSPDGTAAIVKKLQEEYPDRLFMVERKGKLGLGTAYIAGFKWALAHNYQYIFEMDADFSHNPQDRFTLRKWSQCSKLAYGTWINVILRIQLCPVHHRNSDTRHDCRIQMLSPPCSRNHRFGQYTIQGICLSDRNEIYGLQMWI